MAMCACRNSQRHETVQVLRTLRPLRCRSRPSSAAPALPDVLTALCRRCGLPGRLQHQRHRASTDRCRSPRPWTTTSPRLPAAHPLGTGRLLVDTAEDEPPKISPRGSLAANCDCSWTHAQLRQDEHAQQRLRLRPRSTLGHVVGQLRPRPVHVPRPPTTSREPDVADLCARQRLAARPTARRPYVSRASSCGVAAREVRRFVFRCRRRRPARCSTVIKEADGRADVRSAHRPTRTACWPTCRGSLWPRPRRSSPRAGH